MEGRPAEWLAGACYGMHASCVSAVAPSKNTLLCPGIDWRVCAPAATAISTTLARTACRPQRMASHLARFCQLPAALRRAACSSRAQLTEKSAADDVGAHRLKLRRLIQQQETTPHAAPSRAGRSSSQSAPCSC